MSGAMSTASVRKSTAAPSIAGSAPSIAAASCAQWYRPSRLLLAPFVKTETDENGDEHERVSAAPRNDTTAAFWQLADRLISEESEFLTSLDERLDAAWRDVEQITARNKQRAELLEHELPSALRSAILGSCDDTSEGPSVALWTAEMVRDVFQLDVESDEMNGTASHTDGDTSAASATVTSGIAPSTTSTVRSSIYGPSSMKLERIRLKSYVAAHRSTHHSHSIPLSTAATPSSPLLATETPLPESSTDGTPMNRRRVSLSALAPPLAANESQQGDATTPVGTTNAVHAVLQERIDQRFAAPLRKLFYPLLEKKHLLPKETTLLLRAVEQSATGPLREIEAAMEACPLHVPLHAPFSRVSEFINRYLSIPSVAAATEASFMDALRPVTKELEQDYLACRRLWTAEDTQSSTKTDATDCMWRTLLTEAATRSELHGDISNVLNRCETLAAEWMARVPLELTRCADAVARDFAAIRTDAETVSTLASTALAQASAAKQQMEEAYATDRAALDAALKGSWYKVSQSHANQERCARRIREAIKEFQREQAKHVKHVGEYLHLQQASVQVEASVVSLRDYLDQRLMRASAAQSTTAALQDMLRRAEASCNELVAECKRHTARLDTEEHYRRCRMLHVTFENLSQWLRCTNDLGSLYEARSEAVQRKSESSWQLEYLLSHERQQCGKNMDAIRKELLVVDKEWVKLKEHFEAMQLPVPPIDRLDRQDEAMQMRAVFKSVDDDSVVAKGSTQFCDRNVIEAWSKAPTVRKEFEATLTRVLAEQAKNPAFAFAARSLKSVGPKSQPTSHNSARVPKKPPVPDGKRTAADTNSSTGGGGVVLPAIPQRTNQTPRPPHRDAHTMYKTC